MNKKSLSERDICTKFITPAIVSAGWNRDTQIREEVSFTKGRITVRGKIATRGEAKRADYILYYQPNLPIAIVEAKDNNEPLGGGMQQAMEYGTILDIPFVFTSNGDGFLFRDASGDETTEVELTLDQFPTPQALWARYRQAKQLGPAEEELVLQSYHGGKEPRYYQQIAINRTIEAIAKGQQRILLVMATGTGKTYTAFQIIWRLWKAGRKKRILFLADRNILVDQTMVNDFRPFGATMAKLSTSSKTIERDDGTETKLTIALDKKRRIDTAYEIYLGLYQAITGPEDRDKLFREFSPSFFDLIIIDECHRGSADEDSAWREILEYFSSATQVGLTATPKETAYASNIHYFGDPVYQYSLRQGIEDGFLAPYKVIKPKLSWDEWRPQKGEKDKHGNVIEDRVYNEKDFDRTIVIDERTEAIAKRTVEFLNESGDRMQKTIVFCVDTEHASRLRTAIANASGELAKKNSRYVMRITGDDNEGKEQLDNFIDPESTYPVIVTTSRLLSTGVDAQTCRLIVLDREVGSMTEFKQIIGRGTRIHEDTKKYYFTLIDFRKASNHFADPKWDGDAEMIYEPGEDEPITPEDELNAEPVEVPPDVTFSPEPGRPRKYHVKGKNPVSVVSERVEYVDSEGKLVTESLRDYTKKGLSSRFASLEEFLKCWNEATRKQALVLELEAEGLFLEPLAEELGKDLDPFDLICHVAFDQPPLTRKQRTAKVRKLDVFTKYGDKARAVLDVLLTKYQDDGVIEIDNTQVLKLSPFDSMGTLVELLTIFGGREGFLKAVHDLQNALYTQAA
jgi:type I restriction enzyme, R subunit